MHIHTMCPKYLQSFIKSCSAVREEMCFKKKGQTDKLTDRSKSYPLQPGCIGYLIGSDLKFLPDWQPFSLWPVYTLALGGCGTIPRQTISGTIQYTLQCTVGRNSESSKVTTKRDHLVLLESRHIGTQVPSIWISRVSTGCSYTEIIQFVKFKITSVKSVCRFTDDQRGLD